MSDAQRAVADASSCGSQRDVIWLDDEDLLDCHHWSDSGTGHFYLAECLAQTSWALIQRGNLARHGFVHQTVSWRIFAAAAVIAWRLRRRVIALTAEQN
ncbi:hypothetical protein [Hyphomicrobium sp. D-2]|uniref:hypothetical protein n=1 Tax=Hyphomicrobium sp. D-2 TaxID=3041621 RepID=UPI0024540929|nr:hypothetical protein [Hyphomicrobium sp. D-2]MDH4982615.1 hypothetical protein [Hyphomicrobium sp. D-2]